MHKVTAVAAICFLLFGCRATPVSPAGSPEDRPSMQTTDNEEAWIYWANTELDYFDGGLAGHDQVETIARMNFLGNKARHDINLSAIGSGTTLTQPVEDDRSYEWSPGATHIFNTAFWTTLPADCDHRIDARTTHYAWIEYWSPVGPPYQSAKKINTSGATVNGRACAPYPPDEGCVDERDDPDSGGGGEPGSDPPCSGDGGGGGSGEGGETGGLTCTQEWVVLEISYDGGVTWETWWEGYARVCE